eukprot:gnl/TRDRNA2_/TRDRNA2_180160_c0_seq1.p1 gnl/TRDRNA2_/TRDRNA2_180160_c0~~gnl/TRDRNA2_/TRDRNA2_180160_c0_seq1.p1  ORF type:complete len:484 (-),score=40.09 gnl/TRDRNA2_/TRDRNA2_180160_c0_seq1:47-1498(-)
MSSFTSAYLLGFVLWASLLTGRCSLASECIDFSTGHDDEAESDVVALLQINSPLHTRDPHDDKERIGRLAPGTKPTTQCRSDERIVTFGTGERNPALKITPREIFGKASTSSSWATSYGHLKTSQGMQDIYEGGFQGIKTLVTYHCALKDARDGLLYFHFDRPSKWVYVNISSGHCCDSAPPSDLESATSHARAASPQEVDVHQAQGPTTPQPSVHATSPRPWYLTGGQPPAGQPPAAQPQAGQPPAGQPQAAQPPAGQPQAFQPEAGPGWRQAGQPKAGQPGAGQAQAPSTGGPSRWAEEIPNITPSIATAQAAEAEKVRAVVSKDLTKQLAAADAPFREAAVHQQKVRLQTSPQHCRHNRAFGPDRDTVYFIGQNSVWRSEGTGDAATNVSMGTFNSTTKGPPFVETYQDGSNGARIIVAYVCGGMQMSNGTTRDSFEYVYEGLASNTHTVIVGSVRCCADWGTDQSNGRFSISETNRLWG